MLYVLIRVNKKGPATNRFQAGKPARLKSLLRGDNEPQALDDQNVVSACAIITFA